MGNIKKHQQIILDILNEYAAVRLGNPGVTTENEVVADTKNHHYQLIRTGFDKDGAFIYHIVFHFRIKKDGKIWLIHNRTDKDIAETLVERGVAKSNIVLGFHAPKYRAYTGYALA
jgi:XisI protein